jgi:hypothetical protein
VLRGTSSAARSLRAVIQATAPLRGRTKKDYSFSMDTWGWSFRIKGMMPRSLSDIAPIPVP